MTATMSTRSKLMSALVLVGFLALSFLVAAVGTIAAFMYANSGRNACSSAREWRAVPPVAASNVGLPAKPSRSSTSKNVLNSPLYEALKMGLTAIKPSAAITAATVSRNPGLGNPVNRLLVSSWAWSRSSMISASASTPRSNSASTVALLSRSASRRVADG